MIHMKTLYKIINIGIVAMLASVLFLSCEKEEDEKLTLKRAFTPSRFGVANGETAVMLGWDASLFTEGSTDYAVEIAKATDTLFTEIDYSITTQELSLVLTDTT